MRFRIFERILVPGLSAGRGARSGWLPGDLAAGCGRPVPGLIGVASAAAGLALPVLSGPRAASRSRR
jgi:hypothetical protein